MSDQPVNLETVGRVMMQRTRAYVTELVAAKADLLFDKLSETFDALKAAMQEELNGVKADLAASRLPEAKAEFTAARQASSRASEVLGKTIEIVEADSVARKGEREALRVETAKTFADAVDEGLKALAAEQQGNVESLRAHKAHVTKALTKLDEALTVFEERQTASIAAGELKLAKALDAAKSTTTGGHPVRAFYGSWESDKAYTAGAMVVRTGSVWLAREANKGAVPAVKSGSPWMMFLPGGRG